MDQATQGIMPMNRGYLVQTLELIKPALATNNTIPIFQCFCFDENGVYGSDDVIAIMGPSEVDVGGPIALHGSTILGLLSNSSSEEVTFTQKGQEVTVTLGKSVSKLPFMPRENFIFEKPGTKWEFRFLFTESVYEGINLCLNTVSKDTTQPALNGVTIQGDNLFSCDGDVLTRVKLVNSVGDKRTLMSTPFCEAVCRIWKSLEMTTGSLFFSKDWAYAQLGDWSVYGRVLEIPNPIDFENEIKKTINVTPDWQPIPKGLAEALSRARVLADPESQKTKINIGKGGLKMSTETHMGEVKDTLPFKGRDVDLNINAAHVYRALEHGEQISFLENCTLLESPNVLQLVSNMG